MHLEELLEIYYVGIRDCFTESKYHTDIGSKIQNKNYAYDNYSKT